MVWLRLVESVQLDDVEFEFAGAPFTEVGRCAVNCNSLQMNCTPTVISSFIEF